MLLFIIFCKNTRTLQLVLHVLPRINLATNNSNIDHKNTNPTTKNLNPDHKNTNKKKNKRNRDQIQIETKHKQRPKSQTKTKHKWNPDHNPAKIINGPNRLNRDQTQTNQLTTPTTILEESNWSISGVEESNWTPNPISSADPNESTFTTKVAILIFTEKCNLNAWAKLARLRLTQTNSKNGVGFLGLLGFGSWDEFCGSCYLGLVGFCWCSSCGPCY